MTRIPLSLTLMLLLILAPAASLAGEPFRFPEAKHGKGSLRYVSGIPVLTVAGTPEEIGEQAGVLALKPGAKLLTYPHELLKGIGGDLAYSLLLKSGIAMLAHFPADQRKELDAQAKASGQDRDALVVGNTMFDLKKVIACSTLVVEPERSATGGPIFGRNLDFPTCGFLQEYTLVQVCKPAGKHAFASVGFPGMLGVLSGINDAGLTVAVLEVYATADDSLRVDPMGTPYALCFRRLLEECTTVAEAEKALRGMNRTTILNLQVCDKTNAAVFEMTPKTLHVRKAEDGLSVCTNHFRTKGLAVDGFCDRYGKLRQADALKKVSLDDVAKKLNAVNQGAYTLQTMIFEPATLKLHLAYGKCPSSALPMKDLDLAPLLK